MSAFTYASGATPDDYKCEKCTANGCKLWRQYQSFYIELLCVDCAGKDQKKDISSLNERGQIKSESWEGFTDQIGWLVPAVPAENNVSYWGYMSVPEDGCEWWRKLPNRPKDANGTP